MTAPWLSIVGIGEDGWDGLGAAARALVETAELVMGGARHLALVPDTGAERVVWSNLSRALKTVLAQRGSRVCVLASGDPMWFGVGATIARHLDAGEYLVVPQAGAFSLAAARMGWPLQGVATLSVHARPLEALNLHLAPGARLEFGDMAIYTMVKNNTFNGMPLPAICWEDETGDCRIVRRFGYGDFEGRLS